MSRIGKSPIILNKNVTIQTKDQKIIIKGPKGQLEHLLPSTIKIEKLGQALHINNNKYNKKSKELYGLSRTIINNMVIGVSTGFKKILEIQGIGYRAQIDKNNHLILNVGYSHPVNIIPPPEIDIKVENNNRIIVQGINKAVVGQISSQIRAVRPPEPYKGKGIRYHNEVIKKKVGKAGK